MYTAYIYCIWHVVECCWRKNKNKSFASELLVINRDLIINKKKLKREKESIVIMLNNGVEGSTHCGQFF